MNHDHDDSQNHLDFDILHQVHHHDDEHGDHTDPQSWFNSLEKFATHLISDITADMIAEHATDLLGDKGHLGSDHDHLHSFVGDHHDAGFTSQMGEKTCSVVAQKMIMDQFGILDPQTGKAFDESALVDHAVNNGWLTETGGTTIEHMGKLMDSVGIHSHHGNSWEDLLNDLAHGHRVVVAVHTDDADQPFWQQLLDVLIPLPGLDQEPYNHVVVLKGIGMDQDGNVDIVVNDPGNPNGANQQFSSEQLKDSLGRIHYVATDRAPDSWHHHSALNSDSVNSSSDDGYADLLSSLNDEDRFDFLRNI